MNHPDIEVWLFHPAGHGVPGEFKRVEQECLQKGWNFFRIQTRKSSLQGGRVRWLIRSEDAFNLYRRMHRVRVGVCQIGSAYVPMASERRTIAKDCHVLGKFVMHKAFHAFMDEKDFWHDWPSFCNKFQDWMERVYCEGEGDPRCLPLHMFKTNFDLSMLSTKEGRQYFNEVHGPQSNREDDRELRWLRPKGVLHGEDTLRVAGRDLAQGFHWDVTTHRSSRRITTTSEVWEIRRNGYLNIYPDQHVRMGNQARRILPSRKRKARR